MCSKYFCQNGESCYLWAKYEKKNYTMKFRIEKDTIGKVEVPAEAYWGAQTQRSTEF